MRYLKLTAKFSLTFATIAVSAVGLKVGTDTLIKLWNEGPDLLR